MLKKVSKKSLLLFGVVMALCAFVLPSMASAASWFPIGTTGRIDSGNLGFSITALNSGSTCNQTTFHVLVHNAQLATITAASFVDCHGDVSGSVGCTTTAVGTNFPWRATPVNTTAIQIHGVDIDVSFETTPNTPNECANTGLNIRLTGTVTASYTPTAHRFDFLGATGLFAHLGALNGVATVARGNATPTGLLNVLD